MPNFAKLFARILVCGLIPLWVIISAVRLVASDPFLSFEYTKTDFPQDVFSFDQTQRLSYASTALSFVTDDLPISVLEIQRLGELPMYNARELSHMLDVQNVFQAFSKFWDVITVLIIAISTLFYFTIGAREQLARAIKVGGLITVGLIATIGLIAVVDWEAWFQVFHELLFAAGSWTFNYSDTLIRLFPHKFWMDAVFTVSSLSAAGGLLMGVVGWLWLHKIKIGKKAYVELSNMALT